MSEASSRHRTCANIQTRDAPFSGCRNRIGTAAFGSTLGSGKTLNNCVDNFPLGRNGSRVPSFEAGRWPTISPSSQDVGTARGCATSTIGGMAAPCGSVRNVTLHFSPGNRGRLIAYETVTSGVAPRTTVAAVGSNPGEIDRPPSSSAVLKTLKCQRPASDDPTGPV